MRVYITKYALTMGIIVAEAENVGDDMVRVRGAGTRDAYYHGKEWCQTRTEAAKRAKALRGAKIRSLTKSLERVKALRFTAV